MAPLSSNERDEIRRAATGLPSKYPDPWKSFDPDRRPLYGCLSGLEFPLDPIEPFDGIIFSSIFADVFGTTTMAFAPPDTERAPHPGPWVAVRGGSFLHRGRTEVAIVSGDSFPDVMPQQLLWLIAALLRLQVYAPVRLTAIANMPFKDVATRKREAASFVYEAASNQYGVFQHPQHKAELEDVAWVLRSLPSAISLSDEDRFNRAFTVYDQSSWSRTMDSAAVLLWTSLEVLFDLGSERQKTKALSSRLSDFVGADRQDRDRAYQVVRDLYEGRGSFVHAGRAIGSDKLAQSYQLARTVFRRVLLDGVLP